MISVSLFFDKEINILCCKLLISDYQFFIRSKSYKLKLKSLILRPFDISDSLLKKYQSNTFEFIFFKECGYVKIKKIIQAFEKYREFEINVDEEITEYINKNDIYIEKRYNLGADIKKKHTNVFSDFKKFKDIVSSYMQRKLREQQIWDAFFMFSMQKSANFSVPGSGKTSSVLGMFAVLKYLNEVNRIVVVCPLNAFGSWITEYNDCFKPHDYAKFINTSENSTDFNLEQLHFCYENYNLILINFESLSKYVESLYLILENKTMLVFDEVHKVKRINGIYAEYSLNIAKFAKYVVTMTGTPIPNTYADIYNMLNIMFGNEYNDFFGFEPNALKKPSEALIHKINQKLFPFFCRTTKEQLNVPPANEDIILKVNASTLENQIFNILSVKCKNKLELIIRTLQVQTKPNWLLDKIDLDDFKEIIDISDESLDFTDLSKVMCSLLTSSSDYLSLKFLKCIDYIIDLHKQGKIIIVWCVLTKTIELFKQELLKRNLKVEVIYGNVSVEERKRILMQFNLGLIDVIVTNPHTLAESVSLHTVCHDAIYYEYTYNLVHMLQSKDRIHRLGLPINQYTQYHFIHNYFNRHVTLGLNENGGLISFDNVVYHRLLEKEEVMKKAIENDEIEILPSNKDDLDFIYRLIWGN